MINTPRSCNVSKAVFFIIALFFYQLETLAQGTNDWFKNVSVINSGRPVDFSILVDEAMKDTSIVCIGIVNIDLTNDSLKRLDLNKKNDFLACIPNFSLDKVRIKCYNYTGAEQVDLFVQWGENDISKIDGSKRSSFYIITTNKYIASKLVNEKSLLRGLSLYPLKKRSESNPYSVFTSTEIDNSKISGDFCWKLKQNVTYFSNIILPVSPNLPLKKEKCSINFELKTNVGLNQQISRYRMGRFTGGVAFDLGKCNFEIGLNLGLQQSHDFWSNDKIQLQVNNFIGSVNQLDGLIVVSSNVKENYDLSATSGIFGLDLKYCLGKSKAYIGFYGNLVKPIVFDLNFTNTSGEFDYVGISNAIQEPLTNIPELGLVSGVSYVGYKADIIGKLKMFCDFGLMSGYSFGEESPLEINLSLGFTTSKMFNLEQSNSAVSSSYGEYNSFATVNATQVSVPRLYNIGLSVRKYLN